MTSYKVGYLIGSLATKSINRKLALALTKLAPPSLEFTEISFRELPLYSYDYDSDYPPVARAFKDAVSAVDALLFVTPEYNRSIPGGLKNAIDWASRPTGPIHSRTSPLRLPSIKLEQLTVNQRVPGSSPSAPTKNHQYLKTIRGGAADFADA